MFAIEVPDMNDSISSIVIDEVEYGLRFTYNELFDYWSFGLYDEDEEPIIAMTRIVPNFPLFYYYDMPELPKGVFACITEQETIGRDSFLDGSAEFIFMSDEDLAEAEEEENEEDEDEDDEEDE